ncbi:MAG: hypothetical protein FWC60_08575 [Firmicutes bacterium]|nr:hypothetical protein [Bacillota bacterium]
MSNEEKILDLLETLVGKVSALETDVSGLKITQELHTRKLNKLEAALEFQARKLSMIEMEQLELLIRMSDNQDELDRRVSQLEC